MKSIISNNKKVSNQKTPSNFKKLLGALGATPSGCTKKCSHWKDLYKKSLIKRLRVTSRSYSEPWGLLSWSYLRHTLKYRISWGTLNEIIRIRLTYNRVRCYSMIKVRLRFRVTINSESKLLGHEATEQQATRTRGWSTVTKVIRSSIPLHPLYDLMEEFL